LADLLRSRDTVARLDQRGLVLLADDVHAQFDALVADEHRRAGNELAHLMLALAAERAIERVLRIAATDLAHPALRDCAGRRSVRTSSLPAPPLKIRSTHRRNFPDRMAAFTPGTLAKHGSEPSIKI